MYLKLVTVLPSFFYGLEHSISKTQDNYSSNGVSKDAKILFGLKQILIVKNIQYKIKKEFSLK
jgi:hypothetical protein